MNQLEICFARCPYIALLTNPPVYFLYYDLEISSNENATGFSYTVIGNESWNVTFKSYSSNSWKKRTSNPIENDYRMICDRPCFFVSLSLKAAEVGRLGLMITVSRSSSFRGDCTSVFFSLYNTKIITSTMQR